MAVALAVVGVSAGFTGWYVKPPAPRALSRVIVSVLPSALLAPTPAYGDVAITPDGSRIVYQGEPGELYVRALDQLEGEPLRGATGGGDPFVSPNGNWVGFTNGTTLFKVSWV